MWPAETELYSCWFLAGMIIFEAARMSTHTNLRCLRRMIWEKFQRATILKQKFMADLRSEESGWGWLKVTQGQL